MWRRPLLGLLLAATAAMGTAVAQQGDGGRPKVMAKTAQQLVEYAIECMGEAKAPAPSIPSWLGERPVEAPERKPRVVIVGFDQRDARIVGTHREIVHNLLLDRLSGYSEINRVNFSDLGWVLDTAMDVLGQKGSREISKQFDASKTDFVVKLDGRYVASGRRMMVRAVLWRIGVECNKQTEEEAIPLDAFEQTHLTPEQIMREAASKVFAAHKGIERVVILRTLHGVSPIDPKVAGPLEAELKRAIEAAGGPAGGVQQDAQIRSDGDGKAAKGLIGVFRVGAGEFPPTGAGGKEHKGDWLARIQVSTAGAEPAIAVEFRPAIGRERVRFEPATVSSHHVSLRPILPAAELVADPTIDAGPKSLFAFSVQVRRPSAVYCAFQDLDGEAFILYPTPRSQRGEVHQAGSMMAYPQLQGADESVLDAPGSTVVRCLAVPGGLPIELDRRWRDQYHESRVGRGRAAAMSGTEFAQLIEDMTNGREAHETETVLHVLPPRN